MLRIAALVITVLAAAATARAQPGRTAPAPPPVAQPAPVYGPGFTTAPPNLHLLTQEERELLVRGEVGQAEHVIGGLISFVVPLGIAQAVQGRYADTGWIFTVGELGSLVLIVMGAIETSTSFDKDESDGGEVLLLTGVLGLVVFRVWEIVDAWAGPGSHNRKVQAVRLKAYSQPRYGLYLSPPVRASGVGGVAGLSLRF